MMKEVSTQQIIHKLPPSILSKMPHKFADRAQCVSALDERDANGNIYRVNANGETYYYIPSGASIKGNTDFECGQTYELVRGALVINGKPASKITFAAGEPHGTDPVSIDTIIKVISERIIKEAEHRKRFSTVIASLSMITTPTHSK